MKNEQIEFYTWNILKKQLQQNKVPSHILYKIMDDIKIHLYSIIANWCNIEFRNAILIIGSEEGNFYEPQNELIASMVVVTIRNSLLEGICSNNYKSYGCNAYLKDNTIKEITKTAIEYFSKINLSEISQTLDIENDFYKEITNKYPNAIKSLIELAKCTKENREHTYKNNIKEIYVPEELKNNINNTNNLKQYVVEDGISPKFNTAICSYLNDIKDNKSKFFVTDSFKMITRNFEKLLKILEFILTKKAILLTTNYLITYNYVSRRENLLKASHTFEEFTNKLKYLPEVSEKYKDIIYKNFSISVEDQSFKE